MSTDGSRAPPASRELRLRSALVALGALLLLLGVALPTGSVAAAPPPPQKEYAVTISEVGLPKDIPWVLLIGGGVQKITPVQVNGSSYTAYEMPGPVTVQVPQVQDYNPSPENTVITVTNHPVNLTINFTKNTSFVMIYNNSTAPGTVLFTPTVIAFLAGTAAVAAIAAFLVYRTRRGPPTRRPASPGRTKPGPGKTKPKPSEETEEEKARAERRRARRERREGIRKAAPSKTEKPPTEAGTTPDGSDGSDEG